MLRQNSFQIQLDFLRRLAADRSNNMLVQQQQQQQQRPLGPNRMLILVESGTQTGTAEKEKQSHEDDRNKTLAHTK